MSIQQLWETLDLLQIVVFLPLMQIGLLSNIIFFTSQLSQYANFDFISTDFLVEKTLKFLHISFSKLSYS